MSAYAGNYVVPQVLVFQEFRTVATALQQRFYAFICGPNYALFRYNNAEEKQNAYLGDYVRTGQTSYVWPNRPAGATIDQDWVRLFFDNAWLRYAHLETPTYTIRAVEGHPNRVNFDNLNLATYSDGITTWARNAVFQERDVRPGDAVRLTWDKGAGVQTMTSKVLRLVHDRLDSTIGVPTDDADNVGASAQGEEITLTSGTAGLITATADGSSYDGSATGDIEETYIISVVTPGPFGTARVRVTSASANDDPVDTVLPLDGSPVAIGSRGLTVTFATGTGEFESNMIWTVDVAQDWTPATLDAGGIYVGPNSGMYIITVTKGGLWADDPEIFVSSTGTLDSSGPYTVAEGDDIVLPTGVILEFPASASAFGLAQGDRYYLNVAASRNGPIRTIELLNSLPSEVFEDGSEPAAALNAELSLVKNLEIPQLRSSMVPNWTTTDAEITVYPAVTGFDSSWVNSVGTMLEMPVIRADQFVQYRALLNQHANAVSEISDISDVETLLGPAVEANPLSLGVLKALTNSGGVAVKFMATLGDSTTDYSRAIDAVYDRQDTYGLVPLTHNRAVQDLVAAHCLASSVAERGRWRVCWFSAEVEEISPRVITDPSGNMYMGTIKDDPDTTSVVDYTRLHCNEGTFVDDGVTSGDIVRTLYIVDPVTGQEMYQEFVVDAVLTNEDIRLVAGPSTAINVPSRFEIWHPNTRDEQADNVGFFAGTFSSHRVRVVFPDRIGSAGVLMDGMFAAAALAGLRSGVNFHQGLTNVELAGFDDVSRTTEDFSGRQLDNMASKGVWIVTQDTETGMVYTRHQLTTDMSALQFREDSYVSNFDAISYFFLRFFRNSRYIGRRNITPALMAQLDADFLGQVEFLKVTTDVADLGPQLLDAELVELAVHPTLQDRVRARLLLDLPAPLNGLEIYLVA